MDNREVIKQHHQRAAYFFQQSDWENAEKIFEEILRLEPKNHTAFNNLGMVKINRGKNEEARYNFTRAIRANSTYAEAYANLANILFADGNLREAESNYRKAIIILLVFWKKKVI